VGRFGVTPQNICDSPSAEGLTAGVYKELRRFDRAANSQPGAECCSRCLPKRQRALAAALATDANTRRLGCNILDPQACEFRDAETRAYGEVQHSPIPDSRPRGWIRSVEQSLHFFLDQMRYQTSICFLEGDRQNAANLLDGSWFTVLQNRKNERMAARRMFRVSAELPRVVSRCSRNLLTSIASNCSSIRADGATLSLPAANSNND
jgi:hypothetical protein